MSDKIQLGVNGAAGRMGQRIVALAAAGAVGLAAPANGNADGHGGRT